MNCPDTNLHRDYIDVMSLTSLVSDLYFCVAFQLTPKEISRWRLTCKKFNSIFSSLNFWHDYLCAFFSRNDIERQTTIKQYQDLYFKLDSLCFIQRQCLGQILPRMITSRTVHAREILSRITSCKTLEEFIYSPETPENIRYSLLSWFSSKAIRVNKLSTVRELFAITRSVIPGAGCSFCLISAIMYDQSHILEFYLSKGCNPNIIVMHKHTTVSLLSYAICKKAVKCVSCLLKHNTHLTVDQELSLAITMKLPQTIVDELTKPANSIIVDVEDAFCKALKDGNYDTTALWNKVNTFYSTRTAKTLVEHDQLERLKYLVSTYWRFIGKDVETLIVHAIQKDKKQIVDYLLTLYKGKVSVLFQEVISADMAEFLYPKVKSSRVCLNFHLCRAYESDNLSLMEWCLKHGAQADCTTLFNGETLLSVAVKAKNRAVINLLLEHGACDLTGIQGRNKRKIEARLAKKS